MAIPKIAADVIRAVAPTLALALPGPLGMVASALVTGALKVFLPVGPDGGVPAAVTPEQIAQAVQRHAGDPELVKALAAAEKTLADYERKNNFRFAELEVRDRENARAFVRDSGSVEYSRKLGTMAIVWDGVVTLGILGGAFVLMAGVWPITDANVFAALMSFIGIIMGRVSARADTYYNFIFGSSQSSKDKSDQIADTVADLGAALADAPRPAPAAPPPPVVVVPPVPVPAPVLPIDEGPLHQGPFGGQRWHLTTKGVVLEGETKPLRTVGLPATVRRIWKDYGPLIAASCAANAVPLEIAVATIATESAGKPTAMLREPDGRQSVGLLQTLTSTASEMMGRPVAWMELNDPALSIEAGTRYIAKMRPKTMYQPPLVAAAYNAGGLYKAREQDNNPFNLRSTNDHILRLCQFYGDSCAVADEECWSHAEAEKLGPH